MENTLKYKSQAEQRVIASKCFKTTVIDLVGITDEEYNTMQFEGGIDFLTHYISEGKEETLEAWRRELSYSRVFWAWWRNQWLLRDEMLLTGGLVSKQLLYDKKTLLPLYLEINNAERLANEIHPNRVILDASYAEMLERHMKSND